MNNSTNSSPTLPVVQHISPTRSPGSPNYEASSPPATYHHLTPQNPSYQSPPTDVYQSSGSPHYTNSSQSPVVPVPQGLYCPSSLSPSHQIYGNVINPTGFGNFGYSAPGWHGAADYGLFQSTYHYQPAEYIPIINESAYNQNSEPSEKQEPVTSPSPIYQHPNDYSLLQESTGCNRSPGAGNINNVGYSKKTNWTQVTENLTPKI